MANENWMRTYTMRCGKMGKQGFEIGNVNSVTEDCLHVSFSVEKSSEESQNDAKVQIWNLSPKNLSILESKDCVVELKAGYGKNRSLIFVGNVSSAITTLDNADRLTELTVVDGLVELRDTNISVSINGKVNCKTVYQKLANAMGVSVKFAGDLSYATLPNGFSYVDYNDIDQLEKMMSDKTCAVMLEAIQGEGGIHVPDEKYLQQVRKLCDKYNALLIFDEIQCGMGRTGTFFAYEQFGVKADIVTLAKGLAGGVPIGAFMTSNKVAAAFKLGDHGSTFGGNPLACAAANVVLDTIKDDNLMGNAKNVGNYLMGELNKLREKYPALIKEVRGRGLMVGMEINKPGREIVDACLNYGMIINCTAGNVLRFVPPLIINKHHVDELIPVLDRVLAAQ